MISVPTSYNKVHEEELIEKGFNIVIYANHLLRASYPAMKSVAEDILKTFPKLYINFRSLLLVCVHICLLKDLY